MKRVLNFLGNCFRTLVSIIGVFIAFVIVAIFAGLLACIVVYFVLDGQTNKQMNQECAEIQANGGNFHRMDGDKFKAHCYAYWSKND